MTWMKKNTYKKLHLHLWKELEGEKTYLLANRALCSPQEATVLEKESLSIITLVLTQKLSSLYLSHIPFLWNQ